MKNPQELKLLYCEPVTDLLYVCEVTDYKVIDHKIYSEYIIPLDTKNAIMLWKCIEDLNIFIPANQIYLQDYLFLVKKPTKAIITLLNQLTADDIFIHCLSQQKLTQITRQLKTI